MSPMTKTRSISQPCPAGRRRLHGALAGLAVLLLAGCAAESKLVDQSPEFTAERLQRGGLAVLGVVQVEEVAQVRAPLVDALERVLASARRDIPLVPASRVGSAVPDSVERLFLLGYQMRGEPDERLFVAVAEAARGSARYGILARVESAPIRYGSRQITTGLPGDERRVNVVRVTGRDAHVSVRIYDLTTRALVFRGKYVGSSDAAPIVRPPASDSLNAGSGSPVRADPGVRPGRETWIPGPSDDPSLFGYADPPPTARAAEASFLLMARDLPGAPPPPASRGR